MRKLWGGAFGEDSADIVDRFGQSIESDLRFWREDVRGSIAHARMLGQAGIISGAESERLIAGLTQILDDGPDALPKDVEDIHTAVEVRLAELVGDVAGKLHTARSRNDQVATDAKLYLWARIVELQTLIKGLQATTWTLAQAHQATLLPGVTHQQHAQPITVGFHLLASFFAMQRHGWRLAQLERMIGTCPLGSAALSGTSFPIDRTATAAELEFLGPTANAMDATSDRSYVLDALHVCALIMLDLSRSAQEIVVWSSPDFGYIRLRDRVTTGSSIMPQKRNPDMAELIRGRSGRVVGNWVALATTMKGLVHGYNRDTQDDKPTLFESLDITADSLQLMSLMLEGVEVDEAAMQRSMARDFSTATDLADALAKSGRPFREAHEVVGRIVKACIAEGIGLEDLTADRLAEIAPDVPAEMLGVLDPRASAASRNSFGGTGTEAVREQLSIAERLLRDSGFPRPDHLP